MDNKKKDLYLILTVVYCCMLIVSNIIAGRTFDVFNFTLPSAVIVFPVVYIINDILTECFGFENAKKTILLAFVLNLISVLFFQIAIHLPSAQDFSNYTTVLGNTIKALCASFASYLIGSFSNAKIMAVMKNKFKNLLFARCVTSTLIGESLDAMIFISIMFVGVLPLNVVLTMIVIQALAKTLYEIIIYPVTKKIITVIKK